MNLYLSEFKEGFQEQVILYKQGESIFDMGSGPLFPYRNTQSTWQFHKKDGKLLLNDGMNSYCFDFPGNVQDEHNVTRHTDINKDEFLNGGVKGKAQVHRSDPGSIYFTLQEGYQNPTYTLRHTSKDQWRVSPKKVKKKDQPSTSIPIPDNSPAKLGFELGFLKSSGIDQFLGQGLENGLNLGQHTAMLPGEHPLLYGAAAAGLGGLYHGVKRNLYNTKEENEEEDQNNPHALLKRTLIPGLGVAGLGLAEKNLFTAPTPQDKPLYYDLVSMGQKRLNLFGVK